MLISDMPLRTPTRCSLALRAREEQEEIRRIRKSFIDKIEKAGRQATVRLNSQEGLATYQEGWRFAHILIHML